MEKMLCGILKCSVKDLEYILKIIDIYKIDIEFIFNEIDTIYADKYNINTLIFECLYIV